MKTQKVRLEEFERLNEKSQLDVAQMMKIKGGDDTVVAPTTPPIYIKE